jgi:thiamine biosynthesis lipoprotein
MAVFREVDRTCTRFDPDSPLMIANRSPERWHRLPETLFRAIEEAKSAHDATRGSFDPRVIGSLVALGYDRTLPFHDGNVSLSANRRSRPLGASGGTSGAWRPRFRHATREVLLGPAPIDLGGIGKGLAVRWSSEVLAQEWRDFLVEAGGDCFAAGRPADGDAWRIGVEDPSVPRSPICVLALSDRAVTTSSARLRRWVVGGRRAHHLIDPRTGRPGGKGLVSVTVVGEDPARAEVWSKALFLEGPERIDDLSRRRGIPSLWIDDNGRLDMSPAMERYVEWRRK